MLGSDEFCKVGDIGDKNGGVYDQVEPAISSPHNGVEILEHLPALTSTGLLMEGLGRWLRWICPVVGRPLDRALTDSSSLESSPLRQQCQFLVVIHGFPRNKFLSEHIHSVK